MKMPIRWSMNGHVMYRIPAQSPQAGPPGGRLKYLSLAAIYRTLTGDLPIPRQPSVKPPNLYGEHYGAWAQAARQDRTCTQHPIDELLAEHHLMRRMFEAMRTEAVEIARRRPMNLDFWANAVDVIGNFALLIHWRKKANHLFPLIRDRGFAEHLAKLEKEQDQDIANTLELCDAVQDGDRESVVRLVSLYTGAKQRHMEREEQTVLLPSKDVLTPEDVESLRAKFDEVDEGAMPGAGRAHYYGVAVDVMNHVGIDAD